MNNKMVDALCACLTLLMLLTLFVFHSRATAGIQAWSEFSPAPPLDSSEHITSVVRSGPAAYQGEPKSGDIRNSAVIFITTRSSTADRILRYTTAGWTEVYKGGVNTADILRLSPLYSKGDNTLSFAKTNSIRPIRFSTDNGLT
jgi:hypothetical protein